MNSINPSDAELPVLPRRDLRESKVQRFAKLLGDMCYCDEKVIVLNNEFAKLNADTFVVRFTDARKAYHELGYRHASIPQGYDLRSIRAQALADGRVRLTNSKPLQRLVAEAVPGRGIPATARETVRALFTRLAQQQGDSVQDYIIVYGGAEERDWVMQEAANYMPLIAVDDRGGGKIVVR
jgi:hypothetical protein